MDKIYEGICRGGPIDGQDLVHHAAVFNVNIPVYPKVVLDEIPPKPIKPMQFDSELHRYRYVLGQWIWQRYG